MSGPLLITGFHRSGTSAVARSFHSAGVNLGTNLLGAEPANPYGHFEDVDAIEVHDTRLAAEGLSWKSTVSVRDRTAIAPSLRRYVETRDGAEPWGVKDPRICLFLPEWIDVVPDAEIIFVIRPPGPSIASLHRRHARRHVDSEGLDPSDLAFWRDPDLGLKLWCHYHEQALPTLQTHEQRIVLDYSQTDETDLGLHAAIARRGLDPARSHPFDRSLGKVRTIAVHDRSLIDRAQTIWTSLTAIGTAA